MNDQTPKTPTATELLLVGNGASGQWDVALDELAEGGEWLLEIDGPSWYLAFQVHDPGIVSKAASFLDAVGSAPPERKWNEADDTLAIGRFASATVSLVRDNEGPSRCFLVIGRSPGRSTMCLPIESADIESLRDALRQVEQDIEP